MAVRSRCDIPRAIFSRAFTGFKTACSEAVKYWPKPFLASNVLNVLTCEKRAEDRIFHSFSASGMRDATLELRLTPTANGSSQSSSELTNLVQRKDEQRTPQV